MMTAAFWADTLERVVRTFAQALGAWLLASGTGLTDTVWTTGLSVAGMAAVLALLTAVGGQAVGAGPANSASFRRGDTVP